MKKISQEDRSNRCCGIFPFFYCFSFVSFENGMVQVFGQLEILLGQRNRSTSLSFVEKHR